VLRSVRVIGDDPATARALSDRLTRRGVRVDVARPRQVHDMTPVDVLVVLPEPAIDLDDVQTLDALTRRDTTALLQVARVLHDRPTPLIVVTEDVALTGIAVERARPGHAVLSGLATALAEEAAGQPVRVVDLSSLDEAPARVDALVRELDAPPTPGPAERVAWRDGRRLAVAPVLHEVLVAEHAPGLPPDGCYLVTGGAGGVGAHVARLLAGRGRPDLVLVGRSPACPPSLLAELGALGATVRYVAADLTVESAVEQLVAGLPTLDGLVHAAGVVGVGRLRSLSVDDVDQVLGPKVRGSFLLTRALDRRGLRPGKVLAVSSIASALPGYAGGLGAYAAANCFLDAFALAETQAGRPVQVLNFAAWTGTGMAADPAFGPMPQLKGVPAITTPQALQALLDATSRTDAQLLVLPATSSASEPTGVATRPAEPADVSTRGGGPLEAPARHSTDGSVRGLIAGMIAPQLGLRPDELDPEASFLRLGLDSLTAVDLVKSLEAELGRALPTTLLFEHSSVAQLAAYLSQTDPGGPAAKLDPAPLDADAEPFPLTPVQRAFHTNGRLHPGVAAYACLRQQVVGPLDEALLGHAMLLLEQRHPMLRLRIHADGGGQHVESATEGQRPDWFRTVDLHGPVEDVEDELCNRVFHTADEPPVRAVLLHETAERAWLVLVLHHAAADGASLHLLVTELWQVYTALASGRAPRLQPVVTRFRDHVAELERRAMSDAALADRRYWSERLAAASPPTPLPYDGEPDGEPTGPLTAHQFGTSAGLTEALRVRAAELDVSLFHLVLAAYGSQLARWCGQEGITIDVARAGRDSRLPNTASVVGPFADTLPLMVRAVGGTARLAREVREAWLECEQHGNVTTVDLARMLPTVDAAPRTAGAAAFSFARFPVQPQPDCPVTVTFTAARTASAATRLGLLCWEFDGRAAAFLELPGAVVHLHDHRAAHR
jgi:NAD(P)-dependent dehydrogenase (short-subunit alcohol dehydrogenase family)/acyl carrier protein